MPFLTLGNANIKFAQKELTWRFYITAEALAITKWVEIIKKKKFAKTAFNAHVEAFIVHITFLLTMVIYSARKA